MHYICAPLLITTDCIAVGVFHHQDWSSYPLLNQQQQKSLERITQLNPDITKAGKTTVQHFVPGFESACLIVFGLGDLKKYTRSTLRKSMTALGKCFIAFPTESVQIAFPELPSDNNHLFIRQAIISLEDAHIQRDQFKSKPTKIFWPEQISFVGPFEQTEKAIAEGQATAAAIKLAKTLGNLPGNRCTPTILAEQAVAIAKDQPKLTAEIYDEAAIKELKMGCLLAVAQGSVQPPRLIVLHYKGAQETEAPTVLLGKGVTFDSGGISLKPGARMDEMKYDMSGAAAVLATLQAINALQLPINVTGVVVSTENMPSGGAVKPGDIVTSMSGQTVEILNTDAEGRLILCDGLTFIERFKPKAVIDLATLTGAIILALGSEASGLMGNNETLLKNITAAGINSGDRAWQLPLWDEYQELMDSAFADMANIGNGQAGSIIAGCFLARFTENYPWAHLDIAGTAYQGGSNANRASSGRPIALLMDYFLGDNN